MRCRVAVIRQSKTILERSYEAGGMVSVALRQSGISREFLRVNPLCLRWNSRRFGARGGVAGASTRVREAKR